MSKSTHDMYLWLNKMVVGKWCRGTSISSTSFMLYDQLRQSCNLLTKLGRIVICGTRLIIINFIPCQSKKNYPIKITIKRFYFKNRCVFRSVLNLFCDRKWFSIPANYNKTFFLFHKTMKILPFCNCFLKFWASLDFGLFTCTKVYKYNFHLILYFILCIQCRSNFDPSSLFRLSQ